jgi:hypothetical protein
VIDAAAAVRQIMLLKPSRFAWDDFGAGIGAGIGAALVIAGCLAAGRVSRRHRVLAAS